MGQKGKTECSNVISEYLFILWPPWQSCLSLFFTQSPDKIVNCECYGSFGYCLLVFAATIMVQKKFCDTEMALCRSALERTIICSYISPEDKLDIAQDGKLLPKPLKQEQEMKSIGFHL